jgi:hypothetical protein
MPQMKLTRVTRLDALRGVIAGSRAVSLRESALTLFQAGGRRVLPEAVQRAVRGAVEGEASKLLLGAGWLERGAAPAVRLIESGTARVVAVQGAQAAGRQILRSVGAAAGAGAMVDGGWALVQAVRAVQRGTLTRREAALHVVREAGTGAAATAAGTAAAALLVVATGGVAAPAVFMVGAAASLGAKLGLDAWLRARAAGAIVAQPA